MELYQVAGCGEEHTCPKVFVANRQAYVHGIHVTDQATLASARPGAGEALVAIPFPMLLTAALRATFRTLQGKVRVAR